MQLLINLCTTTNNKVVNNNNNKNNNNNEATFCSKVISLIMKI